MNEKEINEAIIEILELIKSVILDDDSELSE